MYYYSIKQKPYYKKVIISDFRVHLSYSKLNLKTRKETVYK